MIKTLYLLRHSQSADKQPGQRDKERELTPRGRKQAIAVGHYIKNQNIHFDLVVSSVAVRAKSTAVLVSELVSYDTYNIRWNEDIYEASFDDLLEVVVQLESRLKSVLVVGHNPAISHLARYLTSAEIADLSPAGLATIQFSFSNWKEIAHRKGDLMNYVDPPLFKD
jgi:phosphohistidine phosphatase